MTKDISRRDVLRFTAIGGAAAAASLAMPGIVRAQSYPSRPINVVVPFATGGYNDRLSRAFAPFLQQTLGQPLNIVNRPGANTILGHQYALQQRPDGYTIMCTSAAPYIPLSILLNDAPYTRDDFHMINLPSRDLTLAAAPANTDIADFGDLIERLKADPSSVSLGVQPSSADYLNLVLVMQANDIDVGALRLVTYDGGGPARNAAVGGQVDVSFVGGEGFLPLMDRIKPLMVFSSAPSNMFPDVPNIGEFAQANGFEAQFVEGSQRGWAVDTAFRDGEPEAYQALETAIEEASKNPECIAALEAQQLATDWYGPDASNQAFLETFDVIERYVDLLRA